MTDDLDPSVLAALQELAEALGSREPPCFGAADRWFAADLAPAIRACMDDCHAVPECGTYADAVGADQGAWAGVDRAARKRAAA